jgi:hypothetical protein
MRELTAFRKAFRRSVARAEVGYASVRFKNGRLWIWAFIKGIIPIVLLRLVAFRPKKTGQVLPCPGNSILRLKGNQDSHHTRFALLAFFRADSLRGEAIRLSEKRSGAGSFGLQIRERMPCFGCEGLLKTTDQGLIQGVASPVHLFRL